MKKRKTEEKNVFPLSPSRHLEYLHQYLTRLNNFSIFLLYPIPSIISCNQILNSVGWKVVEVLMGAN
jgi:hypothetical protein